MIDWINEWLARYHNEVAYVLLGISLPLGVWTITLICRAYFRIRVQRVQLERFRKWNGERDEACREELKRERQDLYDAIEREYEETFCGEG